MANGQGKLAWDEVMSGSAGNGRHGAAPPTARRTGHGKAATGRKRRHSWGRRIGLAIVFTFLGAVIAGTAAFLVLYMRLDVPAADEVALAQTTTVYYADGSTEMGTLSDVNRTIIDVSKLPDYVGHAVVASEDRTFYTNSGVDIKGIARALVNNVSGGARQGASTLTQQYVENYYLGSTHSYTGKVREAILSLKINRSQTKDEILGNYLNTIYFGRGAYGIEAASKAYFGHSASELTLPEAAMLAGIIPAPSAWDPAVDQDKAQQRFERVLGLMVEDGWISQSDADQAKFPDTIAPGAATSSMTGTVGYLMQQVKTELQSEGSFTDSQIDSGGLRIITTIDKAKQDAAVSAAESMTQVQDWNSSTMHTALSSVDPSTGAIVAEFAGTDYQKRQQNAVTQDIAMAGSTFKAFALMAHAQQGGSIDETYDGNSPQTFPGLSDPVYNDGDYSWGQISLKTATQDSVNTAFVGLNEEVGPATTQKVAIEAGIPKDANGLEGTLLNVLGFASPHNIDITRAYATLANGGLRVDPHIVAKVEDSNGATVFTTKVEPTRVFDAGDVSSIIPALEAVMTSDGTGSKAAELGRKVAGKTGTSEDQLSAQFAAFIPQLVTTVSMYQSSEDGKESVPLTNIGGLDQFHGGDWPADVWVKYMEVATQGMPNSDYSWITASTRSPSAPAPVVSTPSREPSQAPTTIAPTQPAAPTTQEPTEEPTSEAPTTGETEHPTEPTHTTAPPATPTGRPSDDSDGGGH